MINAVSARDIQRNFNKIVADVQSSSKPFIVFSRSKPIVALLNLDMLENLQLELVKKEALKEYKAGKTKSIKTVEELKAFFKKIDEAAS